MEEEEVANRRSWLPPLSITLLYFSLLRLSHFTHLIFLSTLLSTTIYYNNNNNPYRRPSQIIKKTSQMTDYWLQSALTNDSLVAELLLRAKHSSDSATPSTSIRTFLPSRWGHRKNRSKSTAPTTTTAAAAAVKSGKEQRGSPTTHLSWSGGGGASSSDGYEEFSRPSDLSSGARSVKVNEGASTSSNHRLEKRKTFPNEQELTSMRVPLNQQLAKCDNLKRIKINLDQNKKNKTRVIEDHHQQMKLPSFTQSCRVEAETVSQQKGFVLPDLNMTPSEEDMAMMMS